jgi:hypothetical protein
MRGFVALLLALVACGGDPAGERPPGLATLELGTGSWRFEPLEDGQNVELVHGAQGGWHIWISLKVSGAAVDQPTVTLSMEPVDASRPAQDTSLPLAFDPPNEQGESKLIGFTGILNDPSCLVGELIRVRASLTTVDGEELSDVREVVVQGGVYPPPPCAE